MCLSTYKCSYKKKCIFNGYLCNIIKIKRIVIHKDYESDVSTSLFLDTGHLLRHTWNKCPYIIHVNPIAKMPPKAFCMDMSTKWKEDLNLLSIYLDVKAQRKAEQQLFLKRNPQVKSLVTDFLISILQRKPENMLAFAKEYFTVLQYGNEYVKEIMAYIEVHGNNNDDQE